jgi:diaminohydroxyphosphoribosylaminopyrimidine deaminase/5-amino-6-(5-phosphoribosylamino)uracil reductase
MGFTAEDHAFMSRALELTARGRDTSTPNPNVGCVIAKAGRIIGEGWHAKASEAHAEAAALAACSESPAGATVYVTLEPCSHPRPHREPCADALVKARVARVVAALEDPHREVQGRGFARLREAGIQAEVGLLAAQAEEAHLGFLHRMRTGRPWMRIKSAASLDGRTALANGASRWITSEAARRDVHALRARSCAVLTGIGTVQQDDPELTVRHVPCTRQPRRVVVDNRLDLSPDAKILKGAPPILFTVSDDRERRARLEALGAEVVVVPAAGAKSGKSDLVAVVRELGARGFNEVTVETGAKLGGSLLAAGAIDEIVLYLAPKLIGDSGLGLFALPELTDLAQAVKLKLVDVRAVGEDWRFTARIVR